MADDAPPPSADSDRPAGGAPATFDPLVGATLADRYEILRRIGEGGMGAVYEARHTLLGKRVAVKVLLEKFHEKADLVARLLQEAQLASAIGHENITDVTDFGRTADGRSFVVMELLDGESLAHLVGRDAPLPIERCLQIARQVASALSAAHEKGIVHRDVKPENVFLVRRGEQDFVKVMDFGVSKAVHTREDGAELLRLTRTGMVLGTPLYMSPEQARGDEDVDARADIWAVGVMLYECLTGEVPFRARNYLGVISQVLNEEVQPPSVLRPELGIPGAVEMVVMRAMEKDRARRYQQMADLVADLDRLIAGDQNVGLAGVPPPPSGAHHGHGKPRWHLGIAAVGVIAIAATIALFQPADERAPEAPSTSAAAGRGSAAKGASARAGAPSAPLPATGPRARPAATGTRGEATGSADAVGAGAAGVTREGSPTGVSREGAGAARAREAPRRGWTAVEGAEARAAKPAQRRPRPPAASDTADADGGGGSPARSRGRRNPNLDLPLPDENAAFKNLGPSVPAP